MKMQAYQAELMGVGKGRVEGKEQVILRLQQRGGEEARNYALSFEDASQLMVVLAGLLVEQEDHRAWIESN
jgi:hypothetical protein